MDLECFLKLLKISCFVSFLTGVITFFTIGCVLKEKDNYYESSKVRNRITCLNHIFFIFCYIGSFIIAELWMWFLCWIDQFKLSWLTAVLTVAMWISIWGVLVLTYNANVYNYKEQRKFYSKRITFRHEKCCRNRKKQLMISLKV